MGKTTISPCRRKDRKIMKVGIQDWEGTGKYESQQVKERGSDQRRNRHVF